MKSRRGLRTLTWLMILLMAWPTAMSAQETQQGAAAPQTYTYSQERLDQLLAPIALYPDPLLSQILMASTYPIEVVEADRWLKQNSNLTGDSLDAALKDAPWDVSVKSLCHFPQILSMMDEKLQETTDLGNAFLSQQNQVMDTIQKLRARAQAQGNLRTTEQQRVTAEGEDIIIEPAYPDVIYVPAYDPCWVYGPWWYPACSPLWFWYPGLVVGVGFFWGPRIFVGPIDFWCGFHWRGHSVFVNVNKTVFVNRVGATRMHGGVETWQHDPVHRRGVAYRDSATARRFGQTGPAGVEARRPFRGFSSEGRGPGQPGARTGPQAGPQMRPESRPGGIEPRGQPGATPGPRGFEQPRSPASQAPGQPRGGGAFQGFGRGGIESQQQSTRGRESMGGGFRGGASSGAGGPSPGGFQGAAPGGGFGGSRGGGGGGGFGGGHGGGHGR